MSAENSLINLMRRRLFNYYGVGNVYLINSKKLQIGIGIGKFSIINSEELHIGNVLGTEP